MTRNARKAVCGPKQRGEQKEEGQIEAEEEEEEEETLNESDKCQHWDCKKRRDGGADLVPNSRYCKRHKCVEVGCSQKVVSNLRCRHHGGGRRCKHEACDKCAVSGFDYCKSHSSGKVCAKDACENMAVDDVTCLCAVHSAKRVRKADGNDNKRRLCSVEGCNKYKRQSGVCVSHGAKVVYARCKMEKCTRQRQSGTSGMCKAHFKDLPKGASLEKLDTTIPVQEETNNVPQKKRKVAANI